jgi:hypothetical protein
LHLFAYCCMIGYRSFMTDFRKKSLSDNAK